MRMVLLKAAFILSAYDRSLSIETDKKRYCKMSKWERYGYGRANKNKGKR